MGGVNPALSLRERVGVRGLPTIARMSRRTTGGYFTPPYLQQLGDLWRFIAIVGPVERSVLLIVFRVDISTVL